MPYAEEQLSLGIATTEPPLSGAHKMQLESHELKWKVPHDERRSCMPQLRFDAAK